MREIVIDTETTGLDPYLGHRLIEIGCVELLNRIPTGNVFHRYVNPERDIPAEVVAIHGIDNERVKNEKVFAEIADELAEFLGDASLVAHNAMFDLGFLNAEMERCGKALFGRERMVDTLLLARRPDRQFAPHQAWRAARCRAFGRGLCRTDRGAASLAGTG
jgi:DNA polymerase-3 subunit epsilon